MSSKKVSSSSGTLTIDDYEYVFKAHYNAMKCYACTMVKDYDKAEDIVQEVFLNLWKNRDQLKNIVSIKSYLYGAIRNACYNTTRQQSMHNKYESHIMQYSSWIEKITAEDMAIAEEVKDAIDQTLESLNPSGKQIFKMSRFENLKYTEIATKLGISIKTVEKHVGLALKAFRKNLAPYINALPPLLLSILENFMQ